MIIDTEKIKALLDDTSITAYKIAKISGMTAAAVGYQRKINDIERMQLSTAVALYKAYQVLKGDKDNNKGFNLLSSPWIPVLTTEGTKEVSITDLFKNASDYRQLAGDSEPQNLAMLRFLLAILQTVYQGRQPKTLINKGFNKALFDYLAANESKFEFQGNNSYLNIDIASFNSLVSDDDKIYPGKKTGTVAIRQIDRRISESKNSPALFSGRSEQYKDTTSISELVRWLITYQGYAGVTDKVKLTQYKDKSISSGGLFKIDPVYIQGKNLFDTLVLNMVFDDKPQRPIWEWKLTDYIDQVTTFPDNTAQLYTLPARLFHIEWNQGEPTIYAAGLPAPAFNEDDFLDPFATTYKDKQGVLRLKYKTLNDFRNEIVYSFKGILVDNPTRIITGLSNYYGVLPDNYDLTITNTAYISDGKPASQTPAAEYSKSFNVTIDTLSDDKKKGLLLAISDTANAMLSSFTLLVKNIESIKHNGDIKPYVEKATFPLNEKVATTINRWFNFGLPSDWNNQLADVFTNYANDNVLPQLSVPRVVQYRSDEYPHNAFEMMGLFQSQINKACEQANQAL